MPFDSYSGLFQEVADLIGRSGLRPKIPGWVSLAESEAVHEIRSLREVRYKVSGNLDAANTELTLIDGIHGIDVMQLDENPVRVVKSAGIAQVVAKRAQSPAAANTFPVIYAWTGPNTIELAPTPHAATPYTIYYTGSMSEVNETKYTSNILEEAPAYLLYAAAFHSAVYTRNSENETRYGAQKDRALAMYKKFVGRKDQKTIQVGTSRTPHDHPGAY